MYQAWISTLIFLSMIRLVTSQQECYFGPGAENRGPSHLVPCSSSGQSACCLLGDTCLSGNTCYNYTTGDLYQYGCTDIHYKDPTCPYKCGWNATLSPWTALEYCTDIENVTNTWTCHAPESCGCSWNASEDLLILSLRGCKEMGSNARVALYAPSALAPYVSLPFTIGGSTGYYSPTVVKGISTWVETAIPGYTPSSVTQLTTYRDAPTTPVLIDPGQAPATSTASAASSPPQTSEASSSASTGTSSASNTTTAAATTTTTTPTGSLKPSSTGLSTGAKVGAGVGAAAGGICLLSLIPFFIWRRGTQHRHGVAQQTEDEKQAAAVAAAWQAAQQQQQQRQQQQYFNATRDKQNWLLSQSPSFSSGSPSSPPLSDFDGRQYFHPYGNSLAPLATLPRPPLPMHMQMPPPVHVQGPTELSAEHGIHEIVGSQTPRMPADDTPMPIYVEFEAHSPATTGGGGHSPK